MLPASPCENQTEIKVIWQTLSNSSAARPPPVRGLDTYPGFPKVPAEIWLHKKLRPIIKPSRCSWTRCGIIAALAFFATPPVHAQGTTATATAVAAVSTNGAVTPLGPGLFGLGLVRVDQRERLVSFPAMINMKEGPVEYLLVATTGKTHESLLRTEARPQDIHLAFLLLGAKGAGTNALPEDPAQPIPGEKVTLEISWKQGASEQRQPAEKFVRSSKTNEPISPGPWIYNGSRLRDDGFAAQLDGSIVSLITDPDALMNNPRPGREDDDYWKAYGGGLPPLHAPVIVSIRLSH